VECRLVHVDNLLLLCDQLLETLSEGYALSADPNGIALQTEIDELGLAVEDSPVLVESNKFRGRNAKVEAPLNFLTALLNRKLCLPLQRPIAL
jgi:hypothetical protein